MDWLWLEETEHDARKFGTTWIGNETESQISLKQKNKSLFNLFCDSWFIMSFFLYWLMIDHWLSWLKILHAPAFSLKNTYLWGQEKCSKPTITVFTYILKQVGCYIHVAGQIQQYLPNML